MIKGQIVSIDLIVSFIIFITAFTIAISVTNRILDQITTSNEISTLNKKLLSISEMMVRTNGMPSNWDNLPDNQIQSIGLAESEYVLNYSKINRLVNLNFDTTRKLMGLDQYNFFFNATNITQGYFPEGPLIGGYQPSNPKLVVLINRFVLIDFGQRREMGILNLILWR